MTIKYFAAPDDFRAWLAQHHADVVELWVGYYKKETGEPSVTWPETVEEALCFGWVDGIRKNVDERRFSIRFTPRKPGSVWSAININKAKELIKQRRMQPSGLAAFEARKENRSGIYSYEQRQAVLDGAYGKKLKAHKAAWVYFQAQPASYRKAVCWWVMTAKKEETRLKRLGQLIELSTKGERIPQFTEWKKRK